MHRVQHLTLSSYNTLHIDKRLKFVEGIRFFFIALYLFRCWNNKMDKLDLINANSVYLSRQQSTSVLCVRCVGCGMCARARAIIILRMSTVSEWYDLYTYKSISFHTSIRTLKMNETNKKKKTKNAKKTKLETRWMASFSVIWLHNVCCPFSECVYYFFFRRNQNCRYELSSNLLCILFPQFIKCIIELSLFDHFMQWTLMILCHRLIAWQNGASHSISIVIHCWLNDWTIVLCVQF